MLENNFYLFIIKLYNVTNLIYLLYKVYISDILYYTNKNFNWDYRCDGGT